MLDRAVLYLRLDVEECILDEATWSCVRRDDAHVEVCVDRLMQDPDG
ncbi:hypothetical protein GCM10022379_18960 [Micromonospora maritima]